MELAFAYLRERDIDILLVEELTVSPEFAAWFCEHVSPKLTGVRVVGVTQSINTKYDGETDIQLVVDTDDGRAAVLIENKIDARPQPNQALRYRTRGEAGLQAGRWGKFFTCLAATEKYIRGPYEASKFDTCVSYEAILNFFESHEGARPAFKAAMLREAIEQNRREAEVETHEESTAFFQSYYDLVQEEAATLNPDVPRPRSAGSRWMVFRPESFPIGVTLRHKLPQGEVRLYIRARGDAVLNIASRLRPLLDSDMVVEWTAASVTVHIEAPPILPRAENVSFSDVRDHLRVAVAHAVRLATLYDRFERG